MQLSILNHCISLQHVWMHPYVYVASYEPWHSFIKLKSVMPDLFQCYIPKSHVLAVNVEGQLNISLLEGSEFPKTTASDIVIADDCTANSEKSLPDSISWKISTVV